MRLHNVNYTVLISPTEPEIIAGLNDIGINTVHTKSVEELILYEQYHADMQLLAINDNAFICGNSLYLVNIVNEHEMKPEICELLEGKYPDNIRLNAALVGNKLICKESSLSQKVKEYCKSEGIEIINVNQGYAKCSTLVINDNAIITADKSILKKAVENGIKALLIRPGFIELNGADYGFIGGCSGVIGDTVVFFGDINTHPDSKIILDFIQKQRFNAVSLLNGPLKDIGGFVQLNR